MLFIVRVLVVPDGVLVSESGRVDYPRPLRDYAEIYGRGPAAIRTWVARGKSDDVRSLPPLDDPAEFLIWWRSHMRQQPPAAIIDAAARSGGESTSPPTEPEPVEEPAGSTDMGATVLELGDPDLERADEGLRQANALRNLAFAEMQDALKGGNSARAVLWRKEWKEAATTSRQWEKDITAILEKRGHLVRKAELVGELTQMFSVASRAFRQQLLAMWEKLLNRVAAAAEEIFADDAPGKPELLGFLDRMRAEGRTASGEGRDACFRNLRENEFGAAARRGALGAE